MDTYYRSIIARVTPPDYDPRHVEAYIRTAHPTLDHMSYHEFCDDIRLTLIYIKTEGADAAEELARSFGL